MRTILFTLIAAIILFTGCKKDKPAGKTNMNFGYPIAYKFESASGTAPIRVFSKIQEINAPNHPSATDDELVNFAPYLQNQFNLYDGMTITLINGSQFIVKYETLADTGIYFKSGDFLTLNGLVYFRQTATALILNRCYSVTKNEFGRDDADINIGERTLPEAVQHLMGESDTTAARAYDLIYKKQ